ncbi:MAG: type II secretion system protein [Patescibacteria group bacterium]
MKKKGGSTIIEMLVVIAIIGILSGMTLIYNRSGAEQLKLFKEEAMVVGLLNRARALAAEKYNKSPDSCAFGIHFTAGSLDFSLFQDLKSSTKKFCKEFDGTYNGSFTYNSGESIQDFALEKGLIFEISISSNLAGTQTQIAAGGMVDIMFVPPELGVVSTVALPVNLKISTPAGGNSKTVIINDTGQISTQ